MAFKFNGEVEHMTVPICLIKDCWYSEWLYSMQCNFEEAANQNHNSWWTKTEVFSLWREAHTTRAWNKLYLEN